MRKILMILSAKPLREDLQERFGDIPSVLIPVEGVPLLDHILENFKDCFDVIYLAARLEHEEQLSSYRDRVQITYLSLTSSIADTITRTCYGRHFLDVERFDVLFGDTLFDKPLDGLDSFTFTKVSDTKRWTSFKQKGGLITDVYDKVEEDGVEDIFTGYFSFSSADLFTNLVQDFSFYKALKAYSEVHRLKGELREDWIDVGHLDKFLEYRAIIAPRHFNSIKIDYKRGVLTKTSEDNEKLQAEISWYCSLPDNLQYLTPQIYDLSVLGDEKQFVKMQYYPWSTVHELILSAQLQPRTVETLLFHLNEMQKVSPICLEVKECIDLMVDMYCDKVVRRLEGWDVTPPTNLGDFIGYPTLSEVKELLHDFSFRTKTTRFRTFTIIHGDYCGSNILVDVDSQFIKLIDPRGSFGSYKGCYGDPLYDVAKLLHSLEGFYDFIIADRFTLKEESGSWNLEVHLTEEHEKCLSRAVKKVEKAYAGVLEKIRFIEATLFLSMVPLHSDYPQRQKAMYITGMRLLRKLHLV